MSRRTDLAQALLRLWKAKHVDGAWAAALHVAELLTPDEAKK